MLKKNYKFLIILIILIILVILSIFFINNFTNYYISNGKYLDKTELRNKLFGKLAIHNSLSSPNLLYKIYYNSDNTFTIYTIKNGESVGSTKGDYRIVSKYNKGYIEINYNKINESPYPESAFSKNNKNSIYKTMKNTLGPFIIHDDKNRSSYILEYNSSYSNEKKFLTIYK
uniref:Uncharacterized protein n=1 Tax=viral metagenome TaxID=1070528 RepID=A0A6C0KR91_9ZZZZ